MKTYEVSGPRLTEVLLETVIKDLRRRQKAQWGLEAMLRYTQALGAAYALRGHLRRIDEGEGHDDNGDPQSGRGDGRLA